ncbi:hypothetical protein D9758_016531 [Tetrapyrgos nigripes]|uniref:Uncharacterized protein n=1 Tax=Tetrapyrgos nigripes TaxID=182062 RepID=A0A8H5CBB2_9AGAR|nr:hypothetical protein D9758_016531 [Tetrapyrgos nigripes]
MTPTPSDGSHGHGCSHSHSHSTHALPWVGPASSLPPQAYHPSNQWAPSSPMPAQPSFVPPPEARDHVPPGVTPGSGGTPLPSNVNVEFMEDTLISRLRRLRVVLRCLLEVVGWEVVWVVVVWEVDTLG